MSEIIIEKKNYRAVKNDLGFAIEHQPTGLIGWVWVKGIQSESVAEDEVEAMQKRYDHERSCPHRIQWRENCALPIEEQFKIDRWFSSLSAEMRAYVITIMEECR